MHESREPVGSSVSLKISETNVTSLSSIMSHTHIRARPQYNYYCDDDNGERVVNGVGVRPLDVRVQRVLIDFH